MIASGTHYCDESLFIEILFLQNYLPTGMKLLVGFPCYLTVVRGVLRNNSMYE
jgi:hypothetical protein